MDEGYFNCPACGAYRPSAHDPRAVFKNGVVVGMKANRCCSCGSPITEAQAFTVGVCDGCWNMAMGL